MVRFLGAYSSHFLPFSQQLLNKTPKPSNRKQKINPGLTREQGNIGELERWIPAFLRNTRSILLDTNCLDLKCTKGLRQKSNTKLLHELAKLSKNKWGKTPPGQERKGQNPPLLPKSYGQCSMPWTRLRADGKQFAVNPGRGNTCPHSKSLIAFCHVPQCLMHYD